jgi:hypothetical protein
MMEARTTLTALQLHGCMTLVRFDAVNDVGLTDAEPWGGAAPTAGFTPGSWGRQSADGAFLFELRMSSERMRSVLLVKH